MNYMEWCETVLRALGEAGDEQPHFRNYGIDEHRLALRIWGDEAERDRYLREPDTKDVLYNALRDLRLLRLAEQTKDYRLRLTRDGRRVVGDHFQVWEGICEVTLDEEEASALKFVNEWSPTDGEKFAQVRLVTANRVTCELANKTGSVLTREDGEELLAALNDKGLVYGAPGEFMEDARSTYAGLVWERRRAEVEGARVLDSFVAEWETTSVEFKRELLLNTADQKAEFVKDVLGLANTQASGRRWLIVGFDDKTRSYHSPPDPSVTQNRIEQVLAQCVAPSLDVRYEVLAYRGGTVGRLEVLRDAKKLPYSVAKSFGEKKQVKENQIFVRHGSQTEAPTPAELDAIREEANRAKTIGGA
jgi:hypothetical protein